jgi:hypothetical protein
MRHAYICPHCNHRSTRRWNLDVHIKRKHGGYLLGRSSGPYTTTTTNNPLFDRKSVQFGHATIPDSVGDPFQPRHSTSIPQYSASPMYPPRQIMDDPSYRTGLSQDTIVKIQELKRLVYKYPKYWNPDGIIKLVTYNFINGDNKFLDEKLAQFRSIDRLASIKS